MIKVSHTAPVLAGVVVGADLIAVLFGPFLGCAAIVVSADVGGDHLVGLAFVGLAGEVHPVGEVLTVVDHYVCDSADALLLEGLDHGAQLGLGAESAVIVVEPVEVVVAHRLIAAAAALRNPDEGENAGQIVGLTLEDCPLAIVKAVPVETLQHDAAVVFRPTLGRHVCAYCHQEQCADDDV